MTEQVTETTVTEATEATEAVKWQEANTKVLRKELEIVATGKDLVLYREVGTDWLFWLGRVDGKSVIAKVRPEHWRECYDDKRWTTRSESWSVPMSEKERKEADKIAAAEAAVKAAAEAAEAAAHERMTTILKAKKWTDAQIAEFFTDTAK